MHSYCQIKTQKVQNRLADGWPIIHVGHVSCALTQVSRVTWGLLILKRLSNVDWPIEESNGVHKK